LTANQHILVSDIADEDLDQIKGLLRRYKLDNLEFTGLRLSSSACVAFPTCGLAMAESERVRLHIGFRLQLTSFSKCSCFR
jgi:sulfite reductase (NADPH) hemoprotein beta-component